MLKSEAVTAVVETSDVIARRGGSKKSGPSLLSKNRGKEIRGMGKNLYTIEWKGEKPTREEVAERFGIDPGDLDEEFGVIEIDPERNLYSILVDDAVVPDETDDQIKGPFSNPKIEPFGLE